MRGVAKPRRIDLTDVRQVRIIPTRFPPVDLFETLVSAQDLEIAYAIESAFNDRVQAEAGHLHLVDRSEWLTGPGSTIVMAAFTHIGRASRFSSGGYGVYYAALDEDTAIAETVFHTERRMRETSEEPIELDMRCHVGDIRAPLEDIRGATYGHLQSPDLGTWPVCQEFAAKRRSDKSIGFLYRSARRAGGECIAGFSTRSVSRPRQGTRLRYCWNGTRIDRVMSIRDIRTL
jgi:hypothetical protein